MAALFGQMNLMRRRSSGHSMWNDVQVCTGNRSEYGDGRQEHADAAGSCHRLPIQKVSHSKELQMILQWMYNRYKYIICRKLTANLSAGVLAIGGAWE